MQYNETISEVIQELKERGYAVERAGKLSVNDTVREGYCVKKAMSNIAPILYDDVLVEMINKGYSKDAIISNIISSVERPEMAGDCKIIEKDFEDVKDQIIYKVISKSRNKKYLEDKPYVQFQGLTLIFQVLLVEEKDSIGCVTITNQMKRRWGINLCDLLSNATRNTRRMFPPVMWGMECTLERLFMGESSKPTNLLEDDASCTEGMYILSNEQGINGATVMMYSKVLDTASRKMNVEKLVILPSSIHEIIVVPYTKDMSVRALQEIITEINGTQVPEEDVLSDTPFLYDRKTDSITIMK